MTAPRKTRLFSQDYASPEKGFARPIFPANWWRQCFRILEYSEFFSECFGEGKECSEIILEYSEREKECCEIFSECCKRKKECFEILLQYSGREKEYSELAPECFGREKECSKIFSEYGKMNLECFQAVILGQPNWLKGQDDFSDAGRESSDSDLVAARILPAEGHKTTSRSKEEACYLSVCKSEADYL